MILIVGLSSIIDLGFSHDDVQICQFQGCFRHKGIIMLCTSTMQCINVDRLDKSLTGKGRRGGPQSQFKVHKVSPGGIRMFESISSPGNYIRLKDGKIDCGVRK